MTSQPVRMASSAPLARTSIRLADGRELIYYDRVPTDRRAPDRRHLPRAQVTSEARFDPVLREWVVIASHRQDRTFLPPTDECPLCPTRGDRLTEVPAAAYEVAVFENRFPSLAVDVPDVATAVDGMDLAGRRPGRGRCEVIVFSDDHEASFADLSPERARMIVDVWAERSAALSALPDVEQVFAFENRGAEIGVTLGHPHGQIYGYPFVTPRTERMLASAAKHRQRTGRNLFADVLAAERNAATRVVAADALWTAFVPAAARWPTEVHLYPNRRAGTIAELTDDERDAFAGLYLDVLRRFDGLYGVAMPYIAAWHQAPVHAHPELSYLHLELFSVRRAPDKLKYLAGSESGMGVFINDVTPERMAAQLRDVRW